MKTLASINRANRQTWSHDVQNTWNYYQCKECKAEFQSAGGVPEKLKEHQEDTGHTGIAGPYK